MKMTIVYDFLRLFSIIFVCDLKLKLFNSKKVMKSHEIKEKKQDLKK